MDVLRSYVLTYNLSNFFSHFFFFLRRSLDFNFRQHQNNAAVLRAAAVYFNKSFLFSSTLHFFTCCSSATLSVGEVVFKLEFQLFLSFFCCCCCCFYFRDKFHIWKKKVGEILFARLCQPECERVMRVVRNLRSSVCDRVEMSLICRIIFETGNCARK